MDCLTQSPTEGNPPPGLCADSKILSLYSRGMSVRDVQAQLQDLYGVDVSAGLISKVTDAVEEERKLWQNRGLDRVYPIVYFDAIVVKVRQDGRVINKAIHLALGVNLAGNKELLGMWMTQNESAKFWLSILTELQNRGLKDIFIACCDGLTGFADAIEAVFPKTQVQLCIVHMVRNSLSYVSYKDRKAVAADLKLIYTSSTEAEAEQQLVEFAQQFQIQKLGGVGGWRLWRISQHEFNQVLPTVKEEILSETGDI
jgi:putative transposase